MSVRELANEAGVNPNTMQRALSELERQELLYCNRTSGRYVTQDRELIMRVKAQIAEERIREFLNNMYQLGYAVSETISLLEKVGMNSKEGD